MFDPQRPRLDHGSFKIQVDPQGDQNLVRIAVEHARSNPQYPGCFALRLNAELQQEGQKTQGALIYEVDLKRGTLVITETWDGLETARRNRPLLEGPEEHSADGIGDG